MKKYIWFFAFITILLVMGFYHAAQTHCIIRNTGREDGQTNCCNGDIRWWHPSTLPVPILVNREGSQQAPGDLTHDAVRRALQSWNQVPSAFFAFVDSGLTDKINMAFDYENVVVFDNDGVNFEEGTSTIAFSRTMTARDSKGYRAVDSDLVFNARDFNFQVDGGQNAMDIETITVHELGHHLGLDHPGGGRDLPASSGCGPVVTNAVMYFAVSQGSVKHDLRPDDIAGITEIYPNWQVQVIALNGGDGQPVVDGAIDLQGTIAPQDTISATTVYTDEYGFAEFAVVNDSLSVSVSTFGYQTESPHVIEFHQPGSQYVNLILQPLPQSTIEGVVRDKATGVGLRATVELYALGEIYRTVETDRSGKYIIDSIPVTDPASTNYDRIRIEPVLPYPVVEIDSGIVVPEGRSLVIDIESTPAEIFIVDDDGGDFYETYFIETLNELDIVPVTWDKAVKGKVEKQFRKFTGQPVIWLTGDETDDFMTEAELDSLRSYMAKGAPVLLSGQNIAEHLQARGSSFLTQVLHVSWSGNVRLPLIYGAANDAIGMNLGRIATAGGDGARNQNSMDILVPDSVANVSAYYDTTAKTVAAISIDKPIPGLLDSRLVFYGFGIEGVNNQAPGFTQRDRIMLTSLNWLKGLGTGVADAVEGVAGINDYRLYNNYPNPFNSETVIRFDVPVNSSDPVHLVIFDVIGRQVRLLVDRQQLQSGHHRAQWDGRDDRGVMMPTGLYFFQMRAGDYDRTMKMLFMR